MSGAEDRAKSLIQKNFQSPQQVLCPHGGEAELPVLWTWTVAWSEYRCFFQKVDSAKVKRNLTLAGWSKSAPIGMSHVDCALDMVFTP